MIPKEAIVTAVKKSQCRQNLYYITVNDGFGEIKVTSKKPYPIGYMLLIQQKNSIDWIWNIVGQPEDVK